MLKLDAAVFPNNRSAGFSLPAALGERAKRRSGAERKANGCFSHGFSPSLFRRCVSSLITLSRRDARTGIVSPIFRRLEIDDEFKLRRLLHRQISRFGTFKILST
jgi:hypothetical protein